MKDCTVIIVIFIRDNGSLMPETVVIWKWPHEKCGSVLKD